MTNFKKTFTNKIMLDSGALNVYTEGSGSVTIVFMSGNGVTSPILEYKPVYRRMSQKYRIAVIEKAGYGFSDNMTTPRTIENLVGDDREALRRAGIEPPYVLAAHSYSGLEAVYWANTYPNEVKALLSMDMGIPDYALLQADEVPDDKRDKLLERYHRFLKRVAKDGIIARLVRNKAENVSGLLTGNALTDDEKKLYRSLFYQNIANREFVEESRQMTYNARKAVETGALKCPCCFFISDMKGMSKKISWRQAGLDYAEKCGGEVHLSDKGHMMYAFIPDEMSETFDKFLEAHDIGVQ
ncbi:MAG: alpha/beta hydrolase [Ruminococcus sp.]|uniref:alpha/beta fold hydrolase n=1 Tax=Ruminococcus sp. TaxID=41978 RepID=UPI0025E3AAD2|nr:alpha/beta hydrolase [Ruminococcus sp.]MCR5601493.1 alpha/beta hydrolase [Ruminococcus sp.]